MRQRLIYLAGAMSQSGDAGRLLAGLVRYVGAQAGLEDAWEASYRSAADGRQRTIRPAPTA